MQPLIPWFEPVEFTIPLGSLNIPIHGFGFLVGMGFVVGSWAAMRRARGLGLDPQVIEKLVIWLLVGTFIGGKLGYALFYAPRAHWEHPEKLLQFGRGLSSYGGFAVCVPLSIWWFRKHKVPLWSFLDNLAYGMGVGWFFGRMGCFVAHDHPGTQTEFWLGVYGMCPGNDTSIACHDLGLYEALWSLAMFGIMHTMDKRAWRPGTLVLTLGLTYAPIRFVMDFFRPLQNDARWGGLTFAQWSCLVLLGVGLSALRRRMASNDAKVMPDYSKLAQIPKRKS
jgi:phosphatidylglycerol:prolipoprotein diacylglycerol transferase